MDRGSCLVTGGAGFIGCAVAADLTRLFGRVVAFDNLHPQVHAARRRPAMLHPKVELVVGDVTDARQVEAVVRSARPRVVIHLAAETGTGQSLTESTRHALVNVVGATTLLDAFGRVGEAPEQIILTSSRAVYGEGAWRRLSNGDLFYPAGRSREQLDAGRWDFEGAQHVPFSAQTTEPRPSNVYGATKMTQEHVINAWAIGFGSHTTILRLQNVYGPGQSLTNSYTGIVSLFCRLAREGKSIPLYEDGAMLRDFVAIEDVARAIIASIERRPPTGRVYDIGSGEATSIRDIAFQIAALYGAPEPHVSGQYRIGDVRHASCDISQTLQDLPWKPLIDTKTGIPQLANWVNEQLAA